MMVKQMILCFKILILLFTLISVLIDRYAIFFFLGRKITYLILSLFFFSIVSILLVRRALTPSYTVYYYRTLPDNLLATMESYHQRQIERKIQKLY